jgi:hypothetical protein
MLLPVVAGGLRQVSSRRVRSFVSASRKKCEAGRWICSSGGRHSFCRDALLLKGIDWCVLAEVLVMDSKSHCEYIRMKAVNGKNRFSSKRRQLQRKKASSKPALGSHMQGPASQSC